MALTRNGCTRTLGTLLIASFLASLCLASSATAAPPQAIYYQGVLLDGA